MGYNFFDHTADVMFQAFGETLSDAFRFAALAMTSVMVDYTKVANVCSHSINVSGERLETLLYEFLQEILYLVDAEEFLLCDVKDLVITQDASGYVLFCVLHGDKNLISYDTDSAVKSVTYSEMFVRQGDEGWTVQVVLDI